MDIRFLTITIGISLIFIIIGLVEFFVLIKIKRLNKNSDKIKDNGKHKIYETDILAELNEKIGYSLGIQNVIEIITKYLGEIIGYNTVSYILPLPGKIIFRSYIEKPVSNKFIKEVKSIMLDSLSAILKDDFKNINVEENLWGTVLDSESEETIGSFFNIPLVISDKFVGLINIADARANFYKEKEILAVNEIIQQATSAVTRLQGVIESEKSKLNAMVFSMTDGVVMTDLDNRIMVANPSAKRAVGLENKNDLSIIDFNNNLVDKIDLKDKIEESIRLEKVFVSEEISLPNGFYKIVISPVKDQWKTLGCVVVFRDITLEKEIEKIKEDFTSMIVHELRSPLDSIKKMVELLRSNEVKKAKREECLQMVYGSSSDMLELINNLLDIAKIEAGKFQILKQESDIKKTIESRVSFFAVSAKDANVKIESVFGKNIPDNIEFDPHTISQVLNNLVSNAIKFTKENGIILVQALLHKKGESLQKEVKEAGIKWFIDKDILNIPDSLIVAVTDNGSGIAPDQINKLFNKFIQAKSTFVEKQGTGLGLAIVKSIVDLHGGVVGVESVEGKGSTFYFTLPASPVKAGQ